MANLILINFKTNKNAVVNTFQENLDLYFSDYISGSVQKKPETLEYFNFRKNIMFFLGNMCITVPEWECSKIICFIPKNVIFNVSNKIENSVS